MTVRNAESMGTYGSSWQAAGYSGSGNVAGLIDSLRDRTAIICGNADGVFDELADVLLKVENPVIYAVNDVGMFLPQVDHWVSLHPDNLGAWKAVRWLQTREHENAKYHSYDSRPFIDYKWMGLVPVFALSGYFAMQIAHIMGVSKIVLCGCPGDATRRFFEQKPRSDFFYGAGPHGSDKSIREQVEKEMNRLPDFKDKVRSMSGWTRDFFGGL